MKPHPFEILQRRYERPLPRLPPTRHHHQLSRHLLILVVALFSSCLSRYTLQKTTTLMQIGWSDTAFTSTRSNAIASTQLSNGSMKNPWRSAKSGVTGLNSNRIRPLTKVTLKLTIPTQFPHSSISLERSKGFSGTFGGIHDRPPGSEPPWMWEDQHIRPLSWRTPRAAFCPRIGEAGHGCSAFASAR